MILEAIKGESPYVPVAPLITTGYASRIYGITPYEYVLNAEKYAQAQIYCKKFHGYDWVWSHQPFQGVSKEEKKTVKKIKDRITFKLEIGAEIMVPLKGTPQVLKPSLTSDEFDLKIPDLYSKERTAPLRYLLEKEDFVCGVVRSPFTFASTFLYDLEKFLIKMKIDRKFVTNLLNFSLRYCMESANALIEAGAHAIYVPDSSSSSSVISPKDYKEIAHPYSKKLIKEISKKVPVILHICGDISEILDGMIDTGAACLSFDELTDIAMVHKKIPVWGNVSSSLLARGSEEEVMEACKKVVELKERVVLSSGCVVPGNAKIENINQMVKASKETRY